jgi:hypothetical protein
MSFFPSDLNLPPEMYPPSRTPSSTSLSNPKMLFHIRNSMMTPRRPDSTGDFSPTPKPQNKYGHLDRIRAWLTVAK